MATVKAKRAAKIKLENPRKPMGEVMIEAGFTEATSKHPKQLTESKGWQQLMEDFLPDKHLADKHREFLDSPKITRKYVKGEIEYEVEETSPEAVKALDMAYKLKGRYKEINIGQALIVNLSPSVAKKYAIDDQPGSDNQ